MLSRDVGWEDFLVGVQERLRLGSINRVETSAGEAIMSVEDLMHDDHLIIYSDSAHDMNRPDTSAASDAEQLHAEAHEAHSKARRRNRGIRAEEEDVVGDDDEDPGRSAAAAAVEMSLRTSRRRRSGNSTLRSAEMLLEEAGAAASSSTPTPGAALARAPPRRAAAAAAAEAQQAALKAAAAKEAADAAAAAAEAAHASELAEVKERARMAHARFFEDHPAAAPSSLLGMGGLAALTGQEFQAALGLDVGHGGVGSERRWGPGRMSHVRMRWSCLGWASCPSGRRTFSRRPPPPRRSSTFSSSTRARRACSRATRPAT